MAVSLCRDVEVITIPMWTPAISPAKCLAGRGLDRQQPAMAAHSDKARGIEAGPEEALRVG